MKKYLESFLSVILLGTSVLLGLAFWLNIKFSFNLFSAQHWNELAKLQAAHIPVNNVFYISVGLAVFLFIFGSYIIFRPNFRKIFKKQTKNTKNAPEQTVTHTAPINETKKIDTPAPVSKPAVSISQPPKLHLPQNMAAIAAAKYQNTDAQQPVSAPKQQPAPSSANRVTIYDEQIAEIFTNNAYLVKTNPTISGFTPNLFAIGNNEVAWIGATDCDINVLQHAIDKLKSVFKETLPDIPITLYAFMLDTKHTYNSTDSIFVFHTIDELAEFISQSQGAEIPESDQENFDAYSDYIDTIIQYIKNV